MGRWRSLLAPENGFYSAKGGAAGVETRLAKGLSSWAAGPVFGTASALSSGFPVSPSVYLLGMAYPIELRGIQ